ncbi:MAG: hypothetical protein M1839_008403 [Geoglossum umbratile]|nr:MAG: hypothetical protein M1839_008403 [Geoglossum umbratile]
MSRKGECDIGIEISNNIKRIIRRLLCWQQGQSYALLPSSDEPIDLASSPSKPRPSPESTTPPHARPKLPFRRIWTPNVLFTMLAQALFDFHLGAFASLWPLLLCTPRSQGTKTSLSPFVFTGGLGMSPVHVGTAMAIIGLTGLVLQFLIYPGVHARLGTQYCYRIFSLPFAVAYGLAPFLVRVSELSRGTRSSDSGSGGGANFLVWLCIALVLSIYVTARAFVMPATLMLLNNCAPHPSVLGTVHGIGQTTSSVFRTLGFVLGGWLYGVGFERGVVGLVWWVVALVAVAGWAGSFFVKEGSGHEIWLEGDGDHD